MGRDTMGRDTMGWRYDARAPRQSRRLLPASPPYPAAAYRITVSNCDRTAPDTR
jgi:hypothetical protein